jgi:hypothetical protein
MSHLQKYILPLCLLFAGIHALHAQQKTKPVSFQKEMEGKTFVVEVYDYNPDGKKTGTPSTDEITFVNGKVYSKKTGTLYGFSPGNYTAATDTSQKGFYVFESSATNAQDQILYWQGVTNGDTLIGMYSWYARQKSKMFFGSLKYKGEDK